MTRDQLVENHRAAFRVARNADDREAAWRALERVHILSQPEFWPHIHSHVDMLGYAIAVRDPKEAVGQLLRLVLAPLGNLTGRLPVGNTGRSNVSAFMSMEIPDDLQWQMQDAGSAN